VAQIKINVTRRNALTNFSRNANADGAHVRNRVNYFTLVYLF